MPSGEKLSLWVKIHDEVDDILIAVDRLEDLYADSHPQDVQDLSLLKYAMELLHDVVRRNERATTKNSDRG